MKKIITLLCTFSLTTITFSQDKGVNNLQQKQVADGSWYKESPSSGFVGIDLKGAQELLKNKKIKKIPIIALIGTGSDIEHEALKNSNWVNPKEKADGIDNDNNGYIDDINGWNFIGAKDGSFMESQMLEGDREWLRLKDKYADIIFDGKNYYTFVNGFREEIKAPSNKEEYNYFKSILKSREGVLPSSYGGYAFTYVVKDFVLNWDKELQAKFPGKARNEITVEDFVKAVYDKNGPQDSLKNIAITMASLYGNMQKSMSRDKSFVPTWEVVYNNFVNRQIDYSKTSYEKNFLKAGNDNRKSIVGDNPLDIKDTKYGNNTLLISASLSGTMFSGIIAGNDVNNTGFSGIIPEAKIMNIVVSTLSGEPYLKDITLAIRYAVANGADIIMLPQQNSFYPPEQKVWVYDAIREAEKKGVLVIVPAWEKGDNTDKKGYYPCRAEFKGKPFSNLMVVANSDSKGNPAQLSNYGEKSLDTYAPGISIYSTAPGDIYKTGTSSSFGAAVTVGSAAVIKAYFPELNGTQIRQLLLDNVTSKRGVEVEKNINKDGKPVNDLFLFEQLCSSAGILNLKNSVEAALKIKK